MRMTRRNFLYGVGTGVVLANAPLTFAMDSRAAVKAALAKRDRAVLVHDSWVRDPFIALGRDGWYYYTGTMQDPTVMESEATRNNVGLGTSTMVGGMVRVYRSRDLLNGPAESPEWTDDNVA